MRARSDECPFLLDRARHAHRCLESIRLVECFRSQPTGSLDPEQPEQSEPSLLDLRFQLVGQMEVGSSEESAVVRTWQVPSVGESALDQFPARRVEHAPKKSVQKGSETRDRSRGEQAVRTQHTSCLFQRLDAVDAVDEMV